MYILITIVFIAELIIALNLINLLIKADKAIMHYNACVEVFNPLAKTCMQYVRCLVSNFNTAFDKIFAFIRKKQQQVISNTLIMTTIYLFLIIFKIRTKKVSKIYKLIGAIRDIAIELAV